MTQDHPLLDRVQNTISGVCGVVAGLSLFGIVVLTLGEVVARQLLRNPIGWNVAFVEQYLMMGMAFGGLVYAYRTGAHIAVKSVYDHLPVAVRKVVIVCSSAIVVVCCGWMAVAGAEFAYHAFALDQRPMPGGSELTIPSFAWKSIMPVCALLCAVLAVIDLCRELSSPASTVVTDYTDIAGVDETEGV